MNTLTKNRILQEGDEYNYDNKEPWKKVPKNDWGLQILFSPYKNMEVRRPSEKPVSVPLLPDETLGATGEIVKRISPKPRALNATAAAESDKTPVASHSATGESPTPEPRTDEASGLPLYVPKKGEKMVTVGAGFSPSNDIVKIKFPKTTTPPIWTGRNGTFNGYGLDLMQIADEVVMLSPIGKRGVGNACIQIPISVIPQLVDWLSQQHKEKHR